MLKIIKTNILLLFTFIGTANSSLAQGPVGQSVELKNPLQTNSLISFFQSLLEIAIVIATPIVIFFIIYAGFLYVTANGNPSKIENAHRAITYAIIGGVLIIGAVAIGAIIENLVNSFVTP